MNSVYKRLVGSCFNLGRHLSFRRKHTTHICVVGSGPAGFFTANQIMQTELDVKVDMFDKCPVPYGLVRYGVAPDHPDIKNVTTMFEVIGNDKKFTFCGNVDLGKDVTLEDLKKFYHAIILCTGCQTNRKLGIPNEEHVISSQQFIGWYNGVEKYADLRLNLDVEDVAVIGNGNVALDVCRMLLLPIEKLKHTDISLHALEALQKSRVKRVHLIGRRGPLQVSFTMLELLDLFTNSGVQYVLAKEDFQGVAKLIPNLPQHSKHLADFLLEKALTSPAIEQDSDYIRFLFKRSPLEIIVNEKSGEVEKLKLGVNELELEDNRVKVKLTDKTEDLPCGMVIRSVGYLGVSPDPSLPFDEHQGIILNNDGRVKGMPGIYCSGWISFGSIGVINTTMMESQSTADLVLEDIEKAAVPAFQELKSGFAGIQQLLQKKGVETVSFKEWKKIDQAEVDRGQKIGKCREKFISWKKMVQIAKKLDLKLNSK